MVKMEPLDKTVVTELMGAMAHRDKMAAMGVTE
jgi:hypothetical protein